MHKIRYLLIFILTCTLLWPGAASAKASAPRFTGTFVQLWDTHATWESARWNDLFASLRAIGVTEIIVQWTTTQPKASQTNAAQTNANQASPAQAGGAETARPAAAPVQLHPALPLLLQAAAAQHMQVVLGLVHDPAYWDKIKAEPDIVRYYLRQLGNTSLHAARAALSLPDSKHVVSGFYIPQEIDDKTWLEPERQSALVDYLTNLRAGLLAVAPGMPVAISGFSNAFAEPAMLEQFWQTVLKKSGIERVLFQDGVGVHKLRLQETGLFMAAVSRAAQKSGGTLTPVVETFRQVDGPPINDKPFRAVPVSLSGLQRQLAIAAAQPHTGIVAFSLPEYCSPYGIKGAADLYVQYKAYIRR